MSDRRLALGSSFGVMQGRLSSQTSRGYQAFPSESWREEFAGAAARGLEHIEWVVDTSSVESNPLLTDPDQILRTSMDSGVRVVSVCADIFMDRPLDKEDTWGWNALSGILDGMRTIGASYLVLPCVDEASLLRESARKRFETSLPTLISQCEAHGVRVALECDLPPDALRELLCRYDSPTLGVNYDSGNSAALGYDLKEEMGAYGRKVTLVHLKDRLVNGPSVHLGDGGADLPGMLQWLVTNRFGGPVTLQAFRDRQGTEVLDAQLGWLETQMNHIGA